MCGLGSVSHPGQPLLEWLREPQTRLRLAASCCCTASAPPPGLHIGLHAAEQSKSGCRVCCHGPVNPYLCASIAASAAAALPDHLPPMAWCCFTAARFLAACSCMYSYAFCGGRMKRRLGGPVMGRLSGYNPYDVYAPSIPSIEPAGEVQHSLHLPHEPCCKLCGKPELDISTTANSPCRGSPGQGARSE
jgi:hypothetical protein